MSQADIGLIGLAVMGENLILNMESRGFTVAVYNRTTSKVDDFVGGRGKGKKLVGCHSVEDLVKALKAPRKIMMMVKAGPAVDQLIDQLTPLLSEGDILIDGGNSFYADTVRRTQSLEAKGFLFIGTGVSGGEEGALTGPSIMPGGSPSAWDAVKPIFQAIAAKVGPNNDIPCCDWVGSDGAGHYVKMVHNGIEYGDMQLICEAYHLLKEVAGLNADEMQAAVGSWMKGELDSYLIEISTEILAFRDEDGQPMVDKILDTAGQKGTGKWTSVNALDLGIPVTLIGEAVYSRCLSAMKEERVAASKILSGPKPKFSQEKKAFIEDVRRALLASKLVSYAQGFMLFREAAKEYNWSLNYGDIALMWRGGCIIRSAFLSKIKDAFDKNPNLMNLLVDDYFKGVIDECQEAWRRVICKAVESGIPVPAFSTALSFYDGYRCARLPANLLQAQRDYFGAHTYERVDKPRGKFFHTNWTGHGGSTSASTYSV